MFFSAAARLSVALALGLSASAWVYDIQVGDANGDTIFSPDTILAHETILKNAYVGDQVKFHFHQKNHTATQSSFAAPCTRLDGGFDSGFHPVPANQTDNFPTYTITIHDVSHILPHSRIGTCLMAYSRISDESCVGLLRARRDTAASHCGKGMVFAVNAPSDGAADSFANFKKAALEIGKELQAGASSSASGSTTAAPSIVTVTKTVTVEETSLVTVFESSTSAAPLSQSSQSANVIKVIVGGANGQLTYTPDHVSAKPNDVVSFEFHQKNHTATQSSFNEPCVHLQDANGNVIGFDSGFMPVADNATDFPVFNVTVKDTAPIWVYCRQHKPDGSSHCGAGMVFAVNAVENSPRNFSAFKALAEKINGTDAANASGIATTANGLDKNGAAVGTAASAVFSLGAVFAAAALLL
ncbi:hypothetical protein BN946_scf184977.g73 [Trametes cinnabarina]|uniref:Phytocyanin domain-containing protein n=1 Tax=Pycnoporus cinnabarinus TaxID=5643 RepID=A0A060SJI9_PYCCI|nr:hypothetical protein BN946_scf184977.g73 [Trametes cinnabarina]